MCLFPLYLFAANVCLRRCPTPEQSPLCLYDWELCSIHVQQRDLADFLMTALAKPQEIATAAKPPGVATSAKLPGIATSANPSNIATSAKLPVVATSAKLPVVATSAKLPVVATSAKLPVVVTSAKLPVVATSAKLPVVGTSAKPPNVATSAEPPVVGTSAKMPIVGTSAEPPVGGTSAKPPIVGTSAKPVVGDTSAKLPVFGTSDKSPCVTTSQTEPPHATSSFIESNWEAHKDDDSASELLVPGSHIETKDGATTNTITPDSAYYYEITRQIEKHLRYYHKELLSCLNLETPQTGEITPIRGEMKKTDDSKETTTYELGPLTKKNICTRNRHVLSKVPDFDLFQKVFDYMVIEAFLDRQLHTAMLSEEYRTEACKRELDIVLFYIESRISLHTFLR